MHPKITRKILLVSEHHMNETRLSVGFCVLFLSLSVFVRSIHAVCPCSLFLLLNSFPGTGYVSSLFIHRWTFHLLLQFSRAMPSSYVNPGRHKQELLWSISLREEWLSQRVYIFWALLDNACFQDIYQKCVRVSHVPHSHQHLVLLHSFFQMVKDVMVSHHGYTLHF